LDQWLVSGRMIVGVFGNLDKDQAVKIAENARSTFALKTVARNELQEFRKVKAPQGESRLNFELVDKKNENSCLVSYFECGQKDDLKSANMVKLLQHYLEQPAFDELRTVQQLGYVVACREQTARDITGFIFLIQSPKFGCSHIRNSLDKHLAVQRIKATETTDEEFKTIQEALCTQIEEQDKNLAQETHRAWNEIVTHQYDWESQAKTAAAIRSITKQEWQAELERVLFSAERCRVDFRYTSEAHLEQEKTTEFKFDEEKLFDSVSDFKQSAGLYSDLFLARYAKSDLY